jgi:catechol 2,3-dioxygenase-like lactoylglutathione lyase family enzyme
MDLDHAVLWVESAKRALEFYVDALGLEPVRAEDFAEGRARFPSVRISEGTILDIMERSELLSLVREFTGSGDDVGGAPINHLCLSMSASEFDSLSARLRERGVEIRPGGENAFGARGRAVRSAYFDDPDGNVLEMRYYSEAK